MLRILRAGLYSLHLALLIYISIIYTLIYLYLINIRLLIRFSATGLLLKILTIIRILLLTGYITALICLESTYLQAYLIALTFSPNISSRYKVAAIYSFLWSLIALRLDPLAIELRAAFAKYWATFISVINPN